MTFGGNNDWKPNNRRNRRQEGKPSRSTSEDADRIFLIILAVFSLPALAVAVLAGVFLL